MIFYAFKIICLCTRNHLNQPEGSSHKCNILLWFMVAIILIYVDLKLFIVQGLQPYEVFGYLISKLCISYKRITSITYFYCLIIFLGDDSKKKT